MHYSWNRDTYGVQIQKASCSQLPQLIHVAVPAHHGCVCHSHPLSFASFQEIRLGAVMTAACHGRKSWIEPHKINLSNLFVSHGMGCVSPYTVFPTREGYVVLQRFSLGREWGITSSCLSPLRGRRSRQLTFCSMVWIWGLQGLGEVHKYIKFATRGGGEGDNWQNLLSPKPHYTC